MRIVLRLSGEAFDLARAEVHALFGSRGRRLRKSNFISLSTTLPKYKISPILDRASMIKAFYVEGNKRWVPASGRWKGRMPTDRAAFHPTILKPKLARTLVNLSRAKKNLLDPFCGSGAILHEAELMGLKAYGSDLDWRAIERCRINIKQHNLRATLKRADATKLSASYKQKFEGIATDPPYGRGSTTAGKDAGKLYREFLVSAAKVLNPSSYLVMIKPKTIQLRIPKPFKLVDKGELYVHGGLTRQILVLKRC